MIDYDVYKVEVARSPSSGDKKEVRLVNNQTGDIDVIISESVTQIEGVEQIIITCRKSEFRPMALFLLEIHF